MRLSFLPSSSARQVVGLGLVIVATATLWGAEVCVTAIAAPCMLPQRPQGRTFRRGRIEPFASTQSWKCLGTCGSQPRQKGDTGKEAMQHHCWQAKCVGRMRLLELLLLRIIFNGLVFSKRCCSWLDEFCVVRLVACDAPPLCHRGSNWISDGQCLS